MFAVLAPKSKPVVLDEDDEARPLPKKRKPVVLEDDDDEPRPLKKKKPVVVEDDDEEDERPRRKKKGKKTAKSNYANSPLRFVILGILVVVMLVMGYFLYRKFTAPPLPDIIVPAKPVPGED